MKKYIQIHKMEEIQEYTDTSYRNRYRNMQIYYRDKSMQTQIDKQKDPQQLTQYLFCLDGDTIKKMDRWRDTYRMMTKGRESDAWM